MARGNFSKCLALTLVHEGGRVHHSKDPGGRTNQGVTQATYNAWRRSNDLPARTVYDMTDKERDTIYRQNYWNKIDADALPLGVDYCLFDLAVNSGCGRANKLLRTLPENSEPPAQVAYVCAERLRFLKGLKTWPTFGRGWSRRVNSVKTDALAMCNSS